MIVSVPVVSLSSSWPSVNVIVCALAKTVGSKVIVWPGTALAAAMASRRLIVPLEKPESAVSAVVLTTLLGITVKVSAGLVTPASDAVITLVPGTRAVATPVPLIVATDGVADAQVTRLVMSAVEPSAKVPVAVNCPWKPTGSSGLPGETAIDTSAAFVRLNEAAPAAPLAVAETV